MCCWRLSRALIDAYVCSDMPLCIAGGHTTVILSLTSQRTNKNRREKYVSQAYKFEVTTMHSNSVHANVLLQWQAGGSVAMAESKLATEGGVLQHTCGRKGGCNSRQQAGGSVAMMKPKLAMELQVNGLLQWQVGGSVATTADGGVLQWWVEGSVAIAGGWAALLRQPKADLGQTTTLGDSEGKGRIGLNCLSVNPKRARMGSLLVLDCTLYILEYMWAARGYP